MSVCECVYPVSMSSAMSVCQCVSIECDRDCPLCESMCVTVQCVHAELSVSVCDVCECV